MFTRALQIGAMAIALAVARPTAAASQTAPPPNRLALVVGEAAYNGDALPTAAADATLVAGVPFLTLVSTSPSCTTSPPPISPRSTRRSSPSSPPLRPAPR